MEIGQLGNWDNDEIDGLYAARRGLLLETLDSKEGRLGVDALNKNVKIMAALSLAQEGHLVISTEDSEKIRLSETGERLARGTRALSWG